MNTVKRLILMLAAGALIGGCATAPKTPAPKQPSVYATAEDRARLAGMEATIAAETSDASREGINHIREAWAMDQLAVMRGDKAVWTEKQLNDERSYVKGVMDGIRKSKTWPAPPPVRVARATSAVAIDGKGSDPDWTRAAAIPIRFPYAKTNAIDGAAATCRLLWDEQNLYLLFEVPDTNVVSACTNRDDAVSLGDCAEIFLLPSMRFGQYWEFNFSPAGLVYDSLIAKYWDRWGGYYRNEENAALTIAVVVDGTLNREEDRDRGYTVEVALPWAELPGYAHGARAGDTLWTMIGWADKKVLAAPGNPAYFSHTPVLAWFHDLWGYSQLTLE